MNTQTIQFATVTKNGVVQKVGKSTIYYSQKPTLKAVLLSGTRIRRKRTSKPQRGKRSSRGIQF